MPTTLPPGVGIGTITGWIEFAVKDPADAYDPDAEAAKGVITFLPSTDLLRGPNVLILTKPITIPLDDQGRFLVRLIATDNPNVVPHQEPETSWFYTMIFAVDTVALSPIEIDVLEGAAQDLVSLI